VHRLGDRLHHGKTLIAALDGGFTGRLYPIGLGVTHPVVQGLLVRARAS
jgi:hypothetical protein